VTSYIENIIEACSRLPYVGLLVRAWTSGEKDLVKDMAASIAFFSLLSLFPMFLGLAAIGSFFLDSADVQVRLSEFVVGILPVSVDYVMGNMESLVRLRGVAGLASVSVLFWSASKMVGALSRGVNAALKIKRSHAFYLSPLRNFGLTITVAILILLVMALIPTLGVLSEFDLGLSGSLWNTIFNSLVGRAAGFIVTVLLLTSVYTLIPYERLPRRDVIPGVLIAAVLIEVGKELFALYFGSVSSLNTLYGSLSSVILLLFWLYFSARVLLYGAEIIREYRINREQKNTDKPLQESVSILE